MSSLEKKQAATRERVKRYRERAKALQSKVGSVTQDVTQYPPILYALTDPIKRKKLEAISSALSVRDLTSKVYYGLRHPVPFDLIGDYLEATR